MILFDSWLITYELQWFDRKKAYLDSLETQLRGLVKAIDTVAKQRAGERPFVSKLGMH